MGRGWFQEFSGCRLYAFNHDHASYQLNARLCVSYSCGLCIICTDCGTSCSPKTGNFGSSATEGTRRSDFVMWPSQSMSVVPRGRMPTCTHASSLKSGPSCASFAFGVWGNCNLYGPQDYRRRRVLRFNPVLLGLLVCRAEAALNSRAV